MEYIPKQGDKEIDLYDIAMTATDTEAEQAGLKDRVTDWFFWKINLKCLLSEAFINRLVKTRTLELINHLEQDLDKIKRDIQLISREIIMRQQEMVVLEGRIKDHYQNYIKGLCSYDTDSILLYAYNNNHLILNRYSKKLKEKYKKQKEWYVLLDALEVRTTKTEHINSYVNEIKGLPINDDESMEMFRDLVSDTLIGEDLKNSDVFSSSVVENHYEYKTESSDSPYYNFLNKLKNTNDSKDNKEINKIVKTENKKEEINKVNDKSLLQNDSINSRTLIHI